MECLLLHLLLLVSITLDFDDDPGITITVKHPLPHNVYLTYGLKPNVEVSFSLQAVEREAQDT